MASSPSQPSSLTVMICCYDAFESLKGGTFKTGSLSPKKNKESWKAEALSITTYHVETYLFHNTQKDPQMHHEQVFDDQWHRGEKDFALVASVFFMASFVKLCNILGPSAGLEGSE